MKQEINEIKVNGVSYVKKDNISTKTQDYSDTPDFILAKYLRRCLENFNETLQERDKWSGANK